MKTFSLSYLFSFLIYDPPNDDAKLTRLQFYLKFELFKNLWLNQFFGKLKSKTNFLNLNLTDH